MRLRVVPCRLDRANAFVVEHHRHHGPVRGHLFSLAVVDPAGQVRGVATIGRPSSRVLDDGWTAEVTRVTTDGCPNACSALYGAAARALKALGYADVYTYTLDSEAGTSLKAAGWEYDGTVAGRDWWTASRAVNSRHSERQDKGRWRRRLADRAEVEWPTPALAGQSSLLDAGASEQIGSQP